MTQITQNNYNLVGDTVLCTEDVVTTTYKLGLRRHSEITKVNIQNGG